MLLHNYSYSFFYLYFLQQDDNRCKTMPNFNLVHEALKIYHRTYGDYRVSSTFTIDLLDTDYPLPIRGCALGRVVQDIRNRKQYTSMQAVEIWQKMGFYSTEEDEKFNKFLHALQSFEKNIII